MDSLFFYFFIHFLPDSELSEEFTDLTLVYFLFIFFHSSLINQKWKFVLISILRWHNKAEHLIDNTKDRCTFSMVYRCVSDIN